MREDESGGVLGGGASKLLSTPPGKDNDRQWFIQPWKKGKKDKEAAQQGEGVQYIITKSSAGQERFFACRRAGSFETPKLGNLTTTARESPKRAGMPAGAKA